MRLGIEKIISDWRKEAGLDKRRNGKYGCRVMYSLQRKDSAITVTIITTHPGPMIGLHGTRYEKFKMLIEDHYKSFQYKTVEIKLLEAHGCV